ncbi:AurF domain containing protein [Paenibacillus sp. LC231]|uniref:diiron oxygenase n=1 Tax=Paenibacillus sp. LC231 TaxID=1120679 RepID=UPI0008DE6048|nr:diiron oxygenase [Paenibacillus sp. LC231]OIB04952.1 AurF domain containing protein [Paenibacillus sp. LC231]
MLVSSKLYDNYVQVLQKLVDIAAEEHYNPYKEFEWTEMLDTNQMWMSEKLLSIYNTPYMERLSKEQIMVLSKWESINFYSLNVHGIRELLIEVIKRIHTEGFELPSEFFHHFVGEENEHMWFFSKFCLKYGGKIYIDKKVKIENSGHSDFEDFLVFARILIFEEIVDYFNICMGNDRTLDPIIQKINKVHHMDESRHISFGREIVKVLHENLREKYDGDKLKELEDYIKRYMKASIHSLYNPIVYKDAGIDDPYAFRNRLLEMPERAIENEKILKRTSSFFLRNGIFTEGVVI